MYQDQQFVKEVPLGKATELGFEDNPIYLQNLYMGRVDGWIGTDKVDPLNDYYDQYLREIEEKVWSETFIGKDKDGGYWVQIGDFVAPLQFKEDKLQFDELIFRSIADKGDELKDSIIRLTAQEQEEIIKKFEPHTVRYDIGYPIHVCDEYHPTKEDRENVKARGWFEKSKSTCYLKSVNRAKGYFGCFEERDCPTHTVDTSGRSELFEKISIELCFWIAREGSFDDTTKCQIVLVHLFGLPPSGY